MNRPMADLIFRVLYRFCQGHRRSAMSRRTHRSSTLCDYHRRSFQERARGPTSDSGVGGPMTRYLLFSSAIVVWVSSLLCMPQAKAESIGMVTGSTTGTYFHFGQDIAKVARTAGLEILVKESEGSI